MEIEPTAKNHDSEQPEPGSGTGKETDGALAGRRSCCARHRMCISGCCCCCLLLLIALGVLAFFLWPRVVVVCLVYSQSSFDLSFSQNPSSAAFKMILPTTIDSKLFVTLYDIDIEIDAFYKGNYDAILAHGKLNDFNLAARSDSSFEVVLSPAELNPAQTNSVVDYFVNQCGPQLLLGTWLADLRITVDLYGQGITVWIRDMELPCSDTGQILNGTASVDSCNEITDLDTSGQYCISLLCAADDLLCEDACDK